ncbi:hypothetical protein B0H16DRAFT_1733345 [Mycena metata]|uniref:Uncharacterized protein n=1 Tax=Mycena metata TaxID=1033252 RepID=A0AAD7HZT4_9AGAR|nr:hypothetical protein B0H16DRAFT_1733345 [Mycena metata]
MSNNRHDTGQRLRARDRLAAELPFAEEKKHWQAKGKVSLLAPARCSVTFLPDAERGLNPKNQAKETTSEYLDRLRYGPRIKAPAPRVAARQYLDRLRYGPQTETASPQTETAPRRIKTALKQTKTAPKQTRTALGQNSPHATVSYNTDSPDAQTAPPKRVVYDFDDPDSFIHESDVDAPVFHREPEWSEASEEDEYNPAGGLPRCPRWNISRRRANTIFELSLRLSPEEAAAKRDREERREERRRLLDDRRRARRALFTPVFNQLIEVGAVKKSGEKAEIGPAPQGFEYVQMNDDIFLSGNGSLTYYNRPCNRLLLAPEYSTPPQEYFRLDANGEHTWRGIRNLWDAKLRGELYNPEITPPGQRQGNLFWDAELRGGLYNPEQEAPHVQVPSSLKFNRNPTSILPRSVKMPTSSSDLNRGTCQVSLIGKHVGVDSPYVFYSYDYPCQFSLLGKHVGEHSSYVLHPSSGTEEVDFSDMPPLEPLANDNYYSKQRTAPAFRAKM